MCCFDVILCVIFIHTDRVGGLFQLYVIIIKNINFSLLPGLATVKFIQMYFSNKNRSEEGV